MPFCESHTRVMEDQKNENNKKKSNQMPQRKSEREIDRERENRFLYKMNHKSNINEKNAAFFIILFTIGSSNKITKKRHQNVIDFNKIIFFCLSFSALFYKI